MRKRGPQPVLDDFKRAQVLAIISVGCSQNTAAEYVGCASATIRRTADRDLRFAQALREARGNAEIGLVRCIRNAAKKEQFWRAAAWALERNFPEKYGRREPGTVTMDEISAILTRFAEIVVQFVPERYRTIVLNRMDAVARSFGINLKSEVGDEVP